jgi:mannan endo-1,4-beta-mannosidase
MESDRHSDRTTSDGLSQNVREPIVRRTRIPSGDRTEIAPTADLRGFKMATSTIFNLCFRTWTLSQEKLRSIIIIITLLHAIAATSAESNPSFVKTTGTSFTVDGKPFFVTGVNNYYVSYGTEVEVKEVLDDAVALGANVIRTFLVPVIGSLDGRIPTIWKALGSQSNDLNVRGNYLLYWNAEKNGMGINEGPNGMQKIDFLITEAKKRQLRLIIAFLDFWDFTGGIQQIAAWYGKGSEFRSPLPHMRDDYFFFTDPRMIKDYHHWVAYVVNRVNPQTGLRYRDDPTIMAWDVANEATAKPDQLRFQWTTEMAAYIKQQDPNHLVTSGNDNLDVEKFDISTSTIDFGTWHGYPKYRGINVDQFDLLIPQYCDAAVLYQKPVLLEEFGYARSNLDQIAAYAKWLNTISKDPNCAGWVVWKLVSHQQNGQYPIDNYDQFDVRRDETALWNVIQESAKRGRADGRVNQ